MERKVYPHPLSSLWENKDGKPQVQVDLGLWYFIIEISDLFKFLTNWVCLDEQGPLGRLVNIDILAGIFLVTRSMAELDFC